MAKKNGPASARIDSVRHKDKRKNIPTEELRDFVAEDERQPKAMLYPRDPSLDPQLVWKGKDEQDAKPLEVPTVPIYIQEKLHPQAVIEDFRTTAAKVKDDGPDLFADFNGLPQDFDKRVDFYHYEGHWQNRMILGDSLLVMNSLVEKEGLKGKVQMIYVDPPYGIKFGSNWQTSTRKREVRDGKHDDISMQPEQIKAFRDTWELGINSYLSYLRDRLNVARELLSESGSIFVQIGDENVHLVRSILDEVFGSENFIVTINLKKKGNQKGGKFESITDYILFYGKNKDNTRYRPLYVKKDATESGFVADQLTSGGVFRTQSYDYSFRGKVYRPASGNSWKIVEDAMRRVERADRVIVGTGQIRFKKYDSDFGFTPLTNNWDDTAGADDVVYVVQTATKAIARCMLMTTDPGDLVLDPTCGGGTTAFVAEQWGRRWITTDTSRVALTLARTRLMTARFPYYLLLDSTQGRQKESQIVGKAQSLSSGQCMEDVRQGFVSNRVPHITLSTIAHDEEIDAIHASWQEKLEPLREKLNKLLKEKWQEWEIPREAHKSWPKAALDLHADWWEKWHQRQQEMDASIARRAETATLYDQPYEDPKRIRVTGPFTVESLSPHRTISVADKKHLAKVGDADAGIKIKTVGPDQFGHMILENLRATPLMGLRKSDRVKFDTVEPYPGMWIQGEGQFTDSDGKARRAAICIGPEHGTIGPELIKESAKEAVQGVGFHLLLVLGFAFDPHVAEEAKRYGKLTVLPVRLNPDLMMGDLLKKTGAANLFMVFGEPDIEIKKQKDERIVVEIKGLDVYDPTTGEIRSSSTDEIACWFIDTNYNGESFFVRHAYFTGAGEPYEKLKRALRAEIDEAAWSALYSTKSRPFPAPKSGKIAVKVINHYGDEVLKVYKL